MNDRLDPSLALPDLAAIRAAHARVRPHVHRTPTLACASIDAEVGARLVFKCENFQRIGAFKARGASNAVFSLADEVARRGVVTHSSGNHGAALAYAAKRRGIPAFVVMPASAPKVKEENVRRFGATVRHSGPSGPEREAVCAQVLAETGGTLIHPFDNADVIAGQGTAALELLDDHPDLDIVIAPCGGGGLLSGSALSAKALTPGCRVVGVEPSAGDDATRSFRTKTLQRVDHPDTVADGARTPSLGSLTFPLILEHVADMLTVDDLPLLRTMFFIWERLKLMVEPTGALAAAALLEGAIDVRGLRVGVVFSGGNVDLSEIPAWRQRL